MKQQIARLSPHQNGKVAAALMAVTSVIFFVPFYLLFWLSGPAIDAPGKAFGPPLFVVVLFPLIYLVMGYVVVALGCVIYNVVFRYIGGIEFVTRPDDA